VGKIETNRDYKETKKKETRTERKNHRLLWEKKGRRLTPIALRRTLTMKQSRRNSRLKKKGSGTPRKGEERTNISVQSRSRKSSEKKLLTQQP